MLTVRINRLMEFWRTTRFDFSRFWGVSVQGLMRPRVVIISKVAFQYPTQMLFAKDNHMIQTLASDRADEPLHIWSLPRTVRRSDYFLNLHSRYSPSEIFAVYLIPISE